MKEFLRHIGVEVVKGKFVCPAHNDHSPSASINPKNPEKWKCFACGAGGNKYDYLLHSKGLDFFEAKKYLNEEVQPLTLQKKIERRWLAINDIYEAQLTISFVAKKINSNQRFTINQVPELEFFKNKLALENKKFNKYYWKWMKMPYFCRKDFFWDFFMMQVIVRIEDEILKQCWVDFYVNNND